MTWTLPHGFINHWWGNRCDIIITEYVYDGFTNRKGGGESWLIQQ